MERKNKNLQKTIDEIKKNAGKSDTVRKLELELKSKSDELKLLQDAMDKINGLLQNFTKVTN